MKTAVWFLAVLLVGSAFAGEQPPSEPAAAIVGGTPIPVRLVDERAKEQLFQVRTKEYEVKLAALNAMIADQLLTREAAARKLTVEELVKGEVEAKAAPVTPEEAQAFYAQQKARLQGRPEAEARQMVENHLRQQSLELRRASYLKELRKAAGVRILLDPPRIAVDPGASPVRGAKDAPVTIVEFSDFQCPYCIRAAPTLEKVRETYGDKVRIAFRDFPLPNHTLAPKAAEAAACAGEQGKFWEMHDKLFASNGKLQVAELKTYATELGLQGESFASCLDGGSFEADWKADVAAGQRYGVTGTPAFFINGRLVGGAQPFENFAAVIDEELERAGVQVPAPPAKQ